MGINIIEAINLIEDYMISYQASIQRLVFKGRGQAYFPLWPGIFFKLARCGYTLRVTSQALYSPEYILTPIQKKL
jgi:hypothetical protein